MSQRALRDARKYNSAGNLIPVIGAGCSIPFGLPNWRNLTIDLMNYFVDDNELHHGINKYIYGGEYWKAIEMIKDFGVCSEGDINEYVAEKVSAYQYYNNIDNNYKDILKINSNIILTTNYDSLLNVCSHHIGLSSPYNPINLNEIDFSSHKLFMDNNRRIIHLHGQASNSGSIVLTERSYKKLYTDEKYKRLFNLIGGSKAFIFIGMSFDDQFMRELMKDHIEVFKSKSFILLDEDQKDKYGILKANFNIEAITYNSVKDGHINGIRKIINELSDNPLEESSEKNITAIKPIGAIYSEEKFSFVENSLFYKKLLLEDVDSLTLEISKLYFVAAEEYILQLRNAVINPEIIEKIFFIVFMKYLEQMKHEYSINKCSQSFVEKVHEILESIDYSRYMDILSKDMHILVHEKQGLIHILANEDDGRIWWGDKRV